MQGPEQEGQARGRTDRKELRGPGGGGCGPSEALGHGPVHRPLIPSGERGAEEDEPVSSSHFL